MKQISVKQIDKNDEFWKEGWEKGFTGFHQSQIHPELIEYVKNHDLKNKNVLVPLCGKSLDMIYLRDQGANVIGVEVVEQAIEEFFNENEINYSLNNDIYSCDGITIFKRDFFSLTSEDIPVVDFLYDRASNVALPMKMRNELYYPTIKRLINKNTRALIITLSHQGDLSYGPPFCVPSSEILDTYNEYSIKQSKTLPYKASDRFKEVGIDKITRHVWQI